MARTTPIDFTWETETGAPSPTSVQISGDYDVWTTKVELVKLPDGKFHKQIPLPEKTKVHFKFIVDGTWTTKPGMPTETDEHNNVNNVITTPESTDVLSTSPETAVPAVAATAAVPAAAVAAAASTAVDAPLSLAEATNKPGKDAPRTHELGAVLPAEHDKLLEQMKFHKTDPASGIKTAADEDIRNKLPESLTSTTHSAAPVIAGAGAALGAAIASVTGFDPLRGDPIPVLTPDPSAPATPAAAGPLASAVGQPKADAPRTHELGAVLPAQSAADSTAAAPKADAPRTHELGAVLPAQSVASSAAAATSAAPAAQKVDGSAAPAVPSKDAAVTPAQGAPSGAATPAPPHDQLSDVAAKKHPADAGAAAVASAAAAATTAVPASHSTTVGGAPSQTGDLPSTVSNAREVPAPAVNGAASHSSAAPGTTAEGAPPAIPNAASTGAATTDAAAAPAAAAAPSTPVKSFNAATASTPTKSGGARAESVRSKRQSRFGTLGMGRSKRSNMDLRSLANGEGGDDDAEAGEGENGNGMLNTPPRQRKLSLFGKIKQALSPHASPEKNARREASTASATASPSK